MSVILTKIVPQGTFPQMWFVIENYYPMFYEGLKFTLIISILGTFFGVLMGMLLVSLKIQTVSARDNFIIRLFKRVGILLSTVYVDVIRGTPMMVQAMILYYWVLFPVFRMGFLAAGIFIVSINTAAYATEVLRGAIQAIDPGQMEAARSLGMTNKQAMIKVILPQAFRNAVPAIGNELVINIKDSSVLSVIGVIEIMYQSKAAASEYYLHVPAYLVAAIMYLFLTLTATRLLEYIVSKTGGDKPENPDSIRRKRRAKQLLSIPTSQSF